jgi:hypothetical protein
MDSRAAWEDLSELADFRKIHMRNVPQTPARTSATGQNASNYKLHRRRKEIAYDTSRIQVFESGFE